MTSKRSSFRVRPGAREGGTAHGSSIRNDGVMIMRLNLGFLLHHDCLYWSRRVHWYKSHSIPELRVSQLQFWPWCCRKAISKLVRAANRAGDRGWLISRAVWRRALFSWLGPGYDFKRPNVDQPLDTIPRLCRPWGYSLVELITHRHSIVAGRWLFAAVTAKGISISAGHCSGTSNPPCSNELVRFQQRPEISIQRLEAGLEKWARRCVFSIKTRVFCILVPGVGSGLMGSFLKEISAIVSATCLELRRRIVPTMMMEKDAAEATLLRSQRLGLGRSYLTAGLEKNF
ncbi:hypothetical protein B0T17DRAFT_342801 [Bombardia bombarda]|uniref:Uncharacterized protein n=1 Tax=Bombardia bombarda TaxID=252184 RepID=A0AA40BYW2_9PEZI|nr:hypothetical protein B0T17DRAFT_342801 [Bombardia bombarda]